MFAGTVSMGETFPGLRGGRLVLHEGGEVWGCGSVRSHGADTCRARFQEGEG